MTVELIYWDSATFLAYFQQEAGRVDLCQGTLERAEAGEIALITSTLTIAECLWLKGQKVPIPRNRAQIVRQFFRKSFIRMRNVTRKTSELAQDMVWDHGVRPKDAIHIATAIEAKVAIIETFDDPFIGKSGLVGCPTLIIRKPVAPPQPRLDLQYQPPFDRSAR
jgi:predicted nucleic acid-binding protein